MRGRAPGRRVRNETPNPSWREEGAEPRSGSGLFPRSGDYKEKGVGILFRTQSGRQGGFTPPPPAYVFYLFVLSSWKVVGGSAPRPFHLFVWFQRRGARWSVPGSLRLRHLLVRKRPPTANTLRHWPVEGSGEVTEPPRHKETNQHHRTNKQSIKQTMSPTTKQSKEETIKQTIRQHKTPKKKPYIKTYATPDRPPPAAAML